jgi:hypothetical protein
MASGVLAFPGTSLLAARAALALPPEGLQKLFGDEAQIQKIGLAYLAACPDENKPGTLQKLCVGVEDSSLAASAIRQDFENGNVVTVEGWVLSRTEARHCALFSMLTSEIG